MIEIESLLLIQSNFKLILLVNGIIVRSWVTSNWWFSVHNSCSSGLTFEFDLIGSLPNVENSTRGWNGHRREGCFFGMTSAAGLLSHPKATLWETIHDDGCSRDTPLKFMGNLMFACFNSSESHTFDHEILIQWHTQQQNSMPGSKFCPCSDDGRVPRKIWDRPQRDATVANMVPTQFWDYFTWRTNCGSAMWYVRHVIYIIFSIEIAVSTPVRTVTVRRHLWTWMALLNGP